MNDVPASNSPLQQVARHAVALKVLAVVMILAGIAALLQPMIFELFAEAFLGWVLVFVGLMRAFTAWSGRTFGEFLLQLAFGILVLVGGMYLLWNPIGGLVSLTIVLTAFMLVEGISKLAMSFQHREAAGLLAFSGMISLLVGVLLFANLKTAWTWALGVLIGIDLVFGGLSLLSFSSAVKRLAARAA